MARVVFQRFKLASIRADSFSRVFYENMEVEEGNPDVFWVKCHPDMCRTGLMNPAALVGIVDGVTSMAFLAKMGFDGFSVSVKLNTQFFQDCFEGDRLKILPFVDFYQPLTKLARVRGEVFRDDELVSVCFHTVCYTGKVSN